MGQGQDGGIIQPKGYRLSPELLEKQVRFGAVAKSALRHTGTAKYRTTAAKHHQIAKECWSIVATEDLMVQASPGAGGRPASYSEAKQALSKLKQAKPATARGLKILRLSEVQGSG